MGSVGDAGVVATAVAAAAAMGNEGSQIGGRVIFPSERGNRGKEIGGGTREERRRGMRGI